MNHKMKKIMIFCSHHSKEIIGDIFTQARNNIIIKGFYEKKSLMAG